MLALLALLCGVIVWGLHMGAFPFLSKWLMPANHNQLLIGDQAKIRQRYPVALSEPIEFDALSKAEVLQLRREAVARHPDLIEQGYRPAHVVFAQIEDGRPWWGTIGQYYHGPGSKSIDGPSEESRYILNPLLLVAADLMGLSPWNNHFRWDSSRVGDGEWNDPGFPLYCRPSELTWWPRESRAEVVYDLGGHIEQLNRYTAAPMSLAAAYFCLMPDNARDLNLNYLAVCRETSTNVVMPEPAGQVVEILHYIHRGDSCGYPGGCNNGSPYQAELDNFRVSALPAHLEVRLWRDRPQDVSEPHEMTFTVRFR